MRISVLVMFKRLVPICLLVVLSAGAMVLAWRLGQRPNPQIVQFLNSPSVVENFTRRASASKADEAGQTKSPLIAQAEAFALYLNPPEPPKRTPPPPRARVARVEVVPAAALSVSPKFRLVGISYHRSKPAESKALVWEAGSGLNWIVQGAELGRMVVRRITRDSILYQDAAGMHEIAIELDATPTIPPQKPQDHRPLEDGSKVTISVPKENPRIQEEPMPVLEAEMNEPRMEKSPVPEDAEPEHGSAPAHSAPGRRPRPIRAVARES